MAALYCKDDVCLALNCFIAMQIAAGQAEPGSLGQPGTGGIGRDSDGWLLGFGETIDGIRMVRQPEARFPIPNAADNGT
jgi:hypothetical protein